MGIDAGFDMVPPLSDERPDREEWARFIEDVKTRYAGDSQVEVTDNLILFRAGEHPMLPFEAHKFLRFSSKITGSIARATDADRYIDTVTQIAKAHFGNRIRPWHEGRSSPGYYDWRQVWNSIKSYDGVKELIFRDSNSSPKKD